MYRALVVCGIYLAHRSDIAYFFKKLSRGMSKPTVGDWERLKRLGRYLVEETRSHCDTSGRNSLGN